MRSVNKLLNLTLAYANPTPEEAELFHRYFLQIMTPEEEDHFNILLKDDPALDFLFDLICVAGHPDKQHLVTFRIKKKVSRTARWNRISANFSRYFTRTPPAAPLESPIDSPMLSKQSKRDSASLQLQIKETLAYTHISPDMVALIKEFFLEPDIPDEKKNEIDNWIRESQVNDQLFDLFCEAFHDTPKSFEKIFRVMDRMMEQKGCNQADQIKQSEEFL